MKTVAKPKGKSAPKLNAVYTADTLKAEKESAVNHFVVGLFILVVMFAFLSILLAVILVTRSDSRITLVTEIAPTVTPTPGIDVEIVGITEYSEPTSAPTVLPTATTKVTQTTKS